MAIWIKTPPDAEPVWMAADNRIRELALSIEWRAGIAPDADLRIDQVLLDDCGVGGHVRELS